MNAIRSKSLLVLGTAMLAGSLFCAAGASAAQNRQSDSMSHDSKMMQQQNDTKSQGSMGTNSMKHDSMNQDSMDNGMQHGAKSQDSMGTNDMKQGTTNHSGMNSDHKMQNGNDD